MQLTNKLLYSLMISHASLIVLKKNNKLKKWVYNAFMRIKDNLKSFSRDYLRVVLLATNSILALSMYISPEPHDFFFWFTLAFRIITIPTALFIGNKGLWFLYFVFCNVKALDITYNNYTCVALLSVLFALTPKVTKKQAVFVIGLYLTDVFIVASLHNKTPFYIYTHILLSAQYCTAMYKQKVFTLQQSKRQNRLLILTPDEIQILSQIENGEPIKTVEGFSEATIYRKLTEARQRNGFSTNEELINEYAASN